MNSLSKSCVIGLAVAMLGATSVPAMGDVIPHDEVTYINNETPPAGTVHLTPLSPTLHLGDNVHYAPRSDNGTESADQLADGVAVSGGTAHVDPALVFWEEDRSAQTQYPDPGWNDPPPGGYGGDDNYWNGPYPNTTFNLGGVYSSLASIQTWSGYFSAAGINGPSGIAVSFSLDDLTYSPQVLYNSAPEGYPNDLAFTYHTMTEPIGYNTANFRYVNIEWQPQANPSGQFGFITVGEVTFDGELVPEPSTWMLLTSVLMGLAGCVRRKKKK
jgi:hypothetical protein